jgi:hypothetical protein
MEKSKYETLSDNSLFKFLKYLYKDSEGLIDGDWINSYDSIVQNQVEKSLKKFGLELNEIDIDFFWETLHLNFKQVSEYDKLEFELKIPKVSKYVINIRSSGRDYWSLWGNQSISAYSLESADGYTSSDNFHAFEVEDWYDKDIIDSQTDDWEIESVKPVKNYNEISEQNTIIKKLMKENFENVVSDYNMDELIQMRDIIDEKLKNRISFI